MPADKAGVRGTSYTIHRRRTEKKSAEEAEDKKIKLCPDIQQNIRMNCNTDMPWNDLNHAAIVMFVSNLGAAGKSGKIRLICFIGIF